jgi:hypothetical protein
MLYGSGWTQRWQVAADQVHTVQSQLSAVGTDNTGHLQVLDPDSDAEVTLFVAWAQVAVAVLTDVDTPPGGDAGGGQYR